MKPSAVDLRVLIIAIQHPIDPSWRIRPGARLAARRLAAMLEGPGRDVRLLVDDAEREDHRPTLSATLGQLHWLKEAPRGLLVISGHFQSDRLHTRDTRAGMEDRTALEISEINALLPEDCGVIVDGGLTSEDMPRATWILAAGGPGIPPATMGSQGPTRFMHHVLRGLGGQAAPGAGITAHDLARYVVDYVAAPGSFPGVGPWSRGRWPRWPEPLATPGAPDQCPRCGAAVPDPSAAFCPACGDSLQAPERLDRGRYRLLYPLGAGGMGTVYVAEDTRLQVRRAVKILALPEQIPPEVAQSLADRMIQEAKAAQALGEHSHHVVRVFDVGYAPERGQPYLVMELLDGITLTDRLTKGAMTVGEAVQICLILARALALAHDMGLIHRDLKPDNVMLVRRGDDPAFVKLLDFGLVKMEEGLVKTASGRMMGTLQYMPPEQLKGQTVDARADVFSLGAVLYECLSGRRANPGHTQREIFSVLLDRGVIPLGDVAPEVPTPLAQLVDRCLALDPDHRPEDAGALAAALGDLQATLSAEALAITLAPAPTPSPDRPPVLSAPPSAPPMLPARPGVKVILALAALLAAAAVILLWPKDPHAPLASATAPAGPAGQATSGATPADPQSTDAQSPEAQSPEAQRPDAALPDQGPPDAGRRAPAEILRGLGALRPEGDGAIFAQLRCGEGRDGDRLISAEWSIPGHTQGSCSGAQCLDALDQALKTSRLNRETLRLSLNLSRGPQPSPEHDAPTPPDVGPMAARCRVSPHAVGLPR